MAQGLGTPARSSRGVGSLAYWTELCCRRARPQNHARDRLTTWREGINFPGKGLSEGLPLPCHFLQKRGECWLVEKRACGISRGAEAWTCPGRRGVALGVGPLRLTLQPTGREAATGATWRGPAYTPLSSRLLFRWCNSSKAEAIVVIGSSALPWDDSFVKKVGAKWSEHLRGIACAGSKSRCSVRSPRLFCPPVRSAHTCPGPPLAAGCGGERVRG